MRFLSNALLKPSRIALTCSFSSRAVASSCTVSIRWLSHGGFFLNPCCGSDMIWCMYKCLILWLCMMCSRSSCTLMSAKWTHNLLQYCDVSFFEDWCNVGLFLINHQVLHLAAKKPGISNSLLKGVWQQTPQGILLECDQGLQLYEASYLALQIEWP